MASPSPTPSSPAGPRRNWSVLAIVAAVVVVGGFVGNKAGDLAHRAPRATGTRIAILPMDTSALGSDVDARGLDLVISRALEDALRSAPGASVVPLEDLRSRLVLMKRGGREGGLEDAAQILSVDAVVTGAVARVAGTEADVLTLKLKVKKPMGAERGAVEVALPGEDPMAEILAAVPKLQPLWGAPASLPRAVADIRAFALDVQGRELLDEGKLVEARERFREAGHPDARAHAALTLTLVRDPSSEQQTDLEGILASLEGVELSPREKLIIDGLVASRRFAAETDEAARVPVGEQAFAAFRGLTVQFPEEALGHLLLGRAYSTLMKAPDEGLHHLESARRLMPEWFPITEEMVATWLQKGSRKQAASELRSYMVLVDNDEAAQTLLKAVDDAPRFN